MFDEKRHLLPPDCPRCGGDTYVSVDYGTPEPHGASEMAPAQEGNGCAPGEYYWSGREQRRQKTDGDYADDLAQFLEGTAPRAVVVDPSASSFIAELRRRGFPC